MTRNELLDLFELMKVQYDFFKPDEKMEKIWYEVLHNFDYNDVSKNLEIAMGDKQFQVNHPSAYYLIQGLTPISKKTNFNDVVIFCPICKKALNPSEEIKHRERCSSIRYLVQQYKKWTGKVLDKRSLWELSEEDFQEKYDKMLHYIYDHTSNKSEKMRIGFIFNPPSSLVAKKFLGNS